MKKILSLLLISLLVGGLAFAITPGYRQSPGTGDIMGQGKFIQDPHKTFRLVRYVQEDIRQANNATADTMVIWQTASDDDGVTVTRTNVSNDSRVAGVIVSNALTQETAGNTAAQDVGLRNWAWLQTCLLYTSPSPRDRQRSRMPSSA